MTMQLLGITLDEVRAIDKEAYIYGFPLVDSHRIQYSYFVDRTDKEYKEPWNQIQNTARVYTPDSKLMPNSKRRINLQSEKRELQQ